MLDRIAHLTQQALAGLEGGSRGATLLEAQRAEPAQHETLALRLPTSR